jgi:multiple sugar transport system ATP-binding protein
VTVFLDHVTKVYDGDVRAVDDVQLQIAKGELLVLLGPSGCGKTTILRMIAGLEEITSGRLWLNGELANDKPTQDRNIAMVFQHGALYPHCTVRQNIAFPLEVARSLDKPSMDARVRELARGLGIEATLDRRPSMLSGGERQRVAMGRALSKSDRAVLLMDEPLASLDASRRHGLREEIGALVRSLDLTTIYVTHDQVEALALADRIAVLRDGALEDVGSPTQVYSNPATAFVASFLGSPPINLLSATVWVEHGERVVIDFGSQQLQLPWTDPRTGILTQYQGLTVLVGIRPDMLSQVGEPAEGSAMQGRIHSLEYHGHEWLARVEIGVRLVDIDTVKARSRRPASPDSPGQAAAAPGRSGRILSWLGPGRIQRSRPASDSVPANHRQPGEHRRADIVVRLDSPRGWDVGQVVSVAVDVASMYLFNADGERIDKVPY